MFCVVMRVVLSSGYGIVKSRTVGCFKERGRECKKKKKVSVYIKHQFVISTVNSLI